jgi:steroid delta-isomerase-like uncharacterized protein
MSDTRQVLADALEAFNSHEEARIRASYADDVVLEAPGEVHLEGAEAATGYAMSWINAFPDARLSAHDRAFDGEWGVQRITFDGTHEATLAAPDGEIPATHRHLNGRAIQMMRVRDGKITEEHLYFDQVQVLTQLGLMPESRAMA